MVQESSLDEESKINRLWIHETTRVFQDRMVGREDKEWFQNLIIEESDLKFKHKIDLEEFTGKKRILFSNIMNLDMPVCQYEEIMDKNVFFNILEQKLEEKLT